MTSREIYASRIALEWQDREMIADMARETGRTIAQEEHDYRMALAWGAEIDSRNQIDRMCREIEERK